MIRTKVIFHTISLLIFLQIISCKSVLDVPKTPLNRVLNTKKSNELSFSIIETGTGNTKKAFAFKGGSLFKNQKVVYSAVLVKHPKGDFLFDTGFGDSIDVQFSEGLSFIYRQLFKHKRGQSVKKQGYVLEYC